MSICYKLYHLQTKTFICLRKRLHDTDRFEGWGHEANWFLATRAYGDFSMGNDHAGDAPECEEKGWTEVKAPPPNSTG